MTSQDPYIGCELSLISTAEIRYTGILSNIDKYDQTVTLSNVKSHGTESRSNVVLPVDPSDEIYEFIIFRGNDIRDLTVTAKPNKFNDPAILELGKAVEPVNLE